MTNDYWMLKVETIRKIEIELCTALSRLLEYGERIAHGNTVPQETWEQHVEYCRQLITRVNSHAPPP